MRCEKKRQNFDFTQITSLKMVLKEGNSNFGLRCEWKKTKPLEVPIFQIKSAVQILMHPKTPKFRARKFCSHEINEPKKLNDRFKNKALEI